MAGMSEHQQGCEPCRACAPSQAGWCPIGWQLLDAQPLLQSWLRHMEAGQARLRQPSLTTQLDPSGARP